jgi:hypothetical protein
MWTFLWLMVFLKIPIVGLYLIIRWAVGQTPETAGDQDGGIGTGGPRVPPRHPHRPGKFPRRPRRGPHGTPMPVSPPRVRAVATLRHGPRV